MPEPVVPEPTPAPVEPAAPVEPETPVEPAPEPAPVDDSAATIAALRAELEAAKPILEAHQKAEDENKSELQREREAREQLETQLAESRRKELHATVAEKTGIPAAVVASFSGATEEDLVAAVEAAKAAVTAAAAPAPANLHSRPKPVVGGGGSKGGGDTEDTPAALAAKVRAAMGY